jgi:hypothetical protein
MPGFYMTIQTTLFLVFLSIRPMPAIEAPNNLLLITKSVNLPHFNEVVLNVRASVLLKEI